MPRVRPHVLGRLAYVVGSVAFVGAASCSGGVELGTHLAGEPDAGSGAGFGAASASDGSAATPGAACGSRGPRGLFPCGAGLFCRYELTAQCGALDPPGTCASPPVTCPSDRIGRERGVCGCDGVTYPDACAAALARTSVRSEKPCVIADAGDDGG
jgi:hypothetical protein